VYPIPGSNMPLATLGAFILWMGWFGFNGGSQLMLSDAENATAVGKIFLNTNAAAAGGALFALLITKLMWGKADLTMVLNGALAGLVTITADPLSPSPAFATLLGALGGVLVVFSIVALDKAKIDDPVGAISVHGVCGLFGLMVVPFSNADATFGAQLYGAAVIFAWVFTASILVWAVLKATMGIRVTEEEEVMGMDMADCGIDAYPEFVSVK
jgi:Amt family ammonium transporter